MYIYDYPKRTFRNPDGIAARQPQEELGPVPREWMVANNGYRIVSHWKPGGMDSGPWPPVLDCFKTLQATYGA